MSATHVYVIRNAEQDITLHIFSKEQDAQEYYIKERVKPYFQTHGIDTACFEDWIIEDVEFD